MLNLITLKKLYVAKRILVGVFLSIFFSCQTQEIPYQKSSLEAIDQEDLRKHVATLASDEFGGRMPFSEGEEKTVNYLMKQFKAVGLEPGNGNSYVQDVPPGIHRCDPDWPYGY